MEHFIHCENVKHYRRLLDMTADETERRRILALLAEEEAKDAAVLQRPAATGTR